MASMSGSGKRLDRSCVHGVLPLPSEDELAAQKQIIAMKRTLRRMEAQLKKHYVDVVGPAYRDAHEGKDPRDYREVICVLDEYPLYQSYKTLGEQAQKLMWTLVSQTVKREAERISAEASRLMKQRPAGGSVTLANPDSFAEPTDVLTVPIHHQPGGYMVDHGPRCHSRGSLEMGQNIRMAWGQVATAGATFCPARSQSPTQVFALALDVGCSAVQRPLYTDMFPGAHVVGIGVGPSMVRYATRGQRVWASRWTFTK